MVCMMFLRVLVIIMLGAAVVFAAQPNSLSEKEKSAGWKLLFDGSSIAGWKTFKGTAIEEKWKVSDGWLQCLGVGGGDIITEQTYEEFDLTFEWKLERGGNSGLKYFVVRERGPIGHEYQILDNDRHPDASKAEGKRLTAAFYDVLACDERAEPRPPMEINKSRVLVKGNHVEHWLNGRRVLTCELGSEKVMAAVAGSKFKDTKSFGTRVRGHILLQDHTDLVWFRNIRIRDLSAR